MAVDASETRPLSSCFVKRDSLWRCTHADSVYMKVTVNNQRKNLPRYCVDIRLPYDGRDFVRLRSALNVGVSSPQNLLNNFLSSDIMSFVARLFLFFQMITVFPLLMYIFRIHLLNTVFGSIYPRCVKTERPLLSPHVTRLGEDGLVYFSTVVIVVVYSGLGPISRSCTK